MSSVAARVAKNSTGGPRCLAVTTGIQQPQNKCSAPVSTKLGICLECHDGTPADPTTYVTLPDHALAA